MKTKYLTKLRLALKKNPALIFPTIVVITFILLVSFKVSGSSIGIYHSFLYGETKDSNLILGTPQSIRSDEWLVNTQMTIAQEQAGYPYINPNFNSNKNMSLLVDTPYKEWSAIFKPQNFSFFVLPLEYAFAFKWWFLLVALLLSAYYFALRILDGKVLLSVLIAVTIGFTPFVFWWYQSGTIMPLTYGFLILLVGMSIIDRKPIIFSRKSIKLIPSTIIKALVLTYLLSCFALIIYPPFQIPIALVAGFFLVGYLLNQRVKTKKEWGLILLPLLGAVVTTAAICGAFLFTRSDVIHSINNTVYPGKRIVASGGYDSAKLLVTYLQPQLQREGRGEKYGLNQSESSSFILMPLFFILPSLALLVWLYLKKRRIDWLLLGLTLCCLLFLVHLFIPGADLLAKVFFLHLVPHERLVIGLGFVTILLLTYLLYVGSKHIQFKNKKLVLVLILYTFLFLLLCLWAGFETSKSFPHFISSKKLIILLGILLYTGLGLVIINKARFGMIIIALFSVASVVQIHPLYRGLGPIYNGEINKTIQQLSNKDEKWAAAQSIYIENFPQISGRAAITGVSAYPDTAFWETYSGRENNHIYNRYAHTFLSTNDSNALVLVGADLFAISSSCSRKVSQKIDLIVSTIPLESSCTTPIKTLSYPKVTFYFYRISH